MEEEKKPYEMTVRIYSTTQGMEVTLTKGKSFDVQGRNASEPVIRVTVTGENELAIIFSPLKFGQEEIINT